MGGRNNLLFPSAGGLEDSVVQSVFATLHAWGIVGIELFRTLYGVKKPVGVVAEHTVFERTTSPSWIVGGPGVSSSHALRREDDFPCDLHSRRGRFKRR